MAAARPEAVPPATPVADWWAVIDDELDQLPEQLRQVILVCEIDGKTRSQAARELGWPEGTVAKRLAKARQELGKRLTRRGVTLGIAAVSTGWAAEAVASVPGRLFAETIRQAPAFALGSHVGSLAVRTLAEGVMRSMKSKALIGWMLAVSRK
jgi:Sigma-70, region 4